MTAGPHLELALARPEDTDALGALLADALPAAAVVYLRGELGAGKSSLARALLRARGVDGPIKSPTYSLVERYATARGDAVHLDLYRIAEAAELDFLGLDEAGAAPMLWLVEWPDRGAARLPAADLDVVLEVAGAGRRANLRPAGAELPGWWATLSKMAGCSGFA
jgi:tRNA threonylcarbamoyl adenosine modification protein YjeE